MRRTLLLGVLSAGGILSTFLFQTWLILALGAGTASDAFFASLALPQLITAVVMATLVNVLVPLLSGETDEVVAPAAWSFVVVTCGGFAFFAAAAWLTAPLWAPLLVPGFSAEGVQLMVELTRIQLIGLWFSTASVVLTSLWQARERFVYAELSLLVASAVSLGALFWALPRWGVRGAAWLSALRMVLLCALLLPGLPRPCRLDLRGPVVREGWRRLRPLLVGNTYLRAGPLVDRVLSSLAPPGGLSLLYLARQVYLGIHLILNKAITAPTVPSLAAYAKRGAWDEFFHTYRSRLAMNLAPTAAGLALVAVAGRPLLRRLVGFGGITGANVDLLWFLLLALGGMLVGAALGQVTTAAFYAAGDTRTPTRIAMLTFTLAIPLKVVLFWRFGLVALALATSLYALTTAGLQMRALGRLRCRTCSPQETG